MEREGGMAPAPVRSRSETASARAAVPKLLARCTMVHRETQEPSMKTKHKAGRKDGKDKS